MQIIKVKNYQEMSNKAAEYIIQKVVQFPNCNLGLATGGTPIGTYQNLIEDHQKNGTSYRDVTTFNLDEYIGLAASNKNSYHYFMNDQLFKHIDINPERTFIPRGDAADIQKECLRYEECIERHGGIDLQLLGIGSNGHIGFNEPGASFESNTHVVNLTQSTINANSRFFANKDEVPTKAITMGIATIMKSKEILLLASGSKKSEALFNLLNLEVNEGFPASILQKHPSVTIIADEEALSRVKI